MSGFLNKLCAKLIAAIAIILFIVSFRDLIITDNNISTLFSGLMETLPFSKKIADVICKLMKYKHAIPFQTSADFLADALKLLIMAVIQPTFGMLLSGIFLRVPSGTLQEQEEYMDKFNYRAKEMLLNVFTTPLFALIAAKATTMISDYISSSVGYAWSIILKVVAILVTGAISILPLAIGGTGILVATLWRIGVTLFGKMIITFGTGAICLWMYLSFIEGAHTQTGGAALTLIVWLILTDFILQWIKRMIASILNPQTR